MSRRSRDLFFVGDFEKKQMRELIEKLLAEYLKRKQIRKYRIGERP